MEQRTENRKSIDGFASITGSGQPVHRGSLAIESAWLKPTICLRYVNETFMIWRHGKIELNKLLNHLDSIQKSISPSRSNRTKSDQS